MARAKKKTTRKKTASKKTSSKKMKMGEPLMVTSKVKAALKNAGCNTSGDAMEGLNMWAYWLIDQAAKRAQANGRKTVRMHDFMNN